MLESSKTYLIGIKKINRKSKDYLNFGLVQNKTS